MYEKRSLAVSHLSCLSLQTATMTSRFPRMLISMTRDRKQIRAIRFGMLSLWKRKRETTTTTTRQFRCAKPTNSRSVRVMEGRRGTQLHETRCLCKKNKKAKNIFLAVSLRPRRKNCFASRFSKRSNSVAQKKPIHGKTDSNLIKFVELITLSAAKNLLERVGTVYNLVGSHLCHI